MNNRQLVVAVAVLVILGAVFLIVSKKEDTSWKRGDNSIDKNILLKNFDVNRVAKLLLRGKHAEVRVERSKTGWVVAERGGFPADFDKVKKFVMKLSKLEVVQKPRVMKSQFKEFGLIQPPDAPDKEEGKEPTNKNAKTTTGVALSLRDGDDKELVGMLFGGFHIAPAKGDNAYGINQNRPDGRYVLMEGTNTPILVSKPLADAVPEPQAWLDKNAVRIFGVLSMESLGDDGKTEWKLYRKTRSSNWILDGQKKDEKLKPYTMSQISAIFERAVFDDVIPENGKNAEAALKNAKTIVVKTSDKFSYTIKMAVKDDKGYIKYSVSADIPEKRAPNTRKNGETEKNLPSEARIKELSAKLEKEKNLSKWIYVYPKYMVEKILKKRSDFVVQATPKTNSGKEKTGTPGGKGDGGKSE